jgi:hypothetical protein
VLISSQKHGFGIREQEKSHLGSRIQGSKEHRIQDPGSGFATLAKCWQISYEVCITREQRLVYLYSDGNVHGGGVGVVAALALVHVVVGVDRLLAPQHTCTHIPQSGFTSLADL